MEQNKRILTIFSLLFLLLFTGIMGYSILLDLSFLDALYMTVITISTVGYTEVGEMNSKAKVFSIVIILLSLGTVGYIFTNIASSLLEGDLKLAWRRRKMEKDIGKLKDHYILCGAGETGLNAIKQFVKSDVNFIVIDKNKNIVDNLIEDGILAFQGYCTTEETLLHCQIRSAKGLIASLSKDADNVYTVLTARQLNDDLYIVSRAIDDKSHGKLKKAGANNTISPNEIGGTRMASLILKPNII